MLDNCKTCCLRRVLSSGLAQDQFEPFYEQKRNCERLIRYLRGLVPTAEAAPENDHATDETSDSADEFPDSFRHLSIKPNTKTKKKQGGLAKKAAKNPTLVSIVEVIVTEPAFSQSLTTSTTSGSSTTWRWIRPRRTPKWNER